MSLNPIRRRLTTEVSELAALFMDSAAALHSPCSSQERREQNKGTTRGPARWALPHSKGDELF